MAGAVQRFDDRRAAVRAEQEFLEGVDTKRAAQLKPLPPRRRELLQVRVPAMIEVDEIADGVVADSLSDMSAWEWIWPVAQAAMASFCPASGRLKARSKRLISAAKRCGASDGRFYRPLIRKNYCSIAGYAPFQIARFDLAGFFKIANEKLLQGFIADLETQYAEAEPTTIIGLTDNNELGALALFGRNELARKDEYVSLEKSFLFVGNDVNTGVSLGRMDDLSDEVGSRTLSVNLAGLRLPTALKSLARSINMQIYLSPAVNAAPQKSVSIFRAADALDIFDILIDNYGLAMAYDRKMGVARFYTRAEFSEQADDAVAAAELHNRRARNLRKISSLENDTAALTNLSKLFSASR